MHARKFRCNSRKISASPAAGICCPYMDFSYKEYIMYIYTIRNIVYEILKKLNLFVSCRSFVSTDHGLRWLR
jgi:hypothetical protein